MMFGLDIDRISEVINNDYSYSGLTSINYCISSFYETADIS